MKYIFVTLCFFISLASFAQRADRIVRGSVLDDKDGRPVIGAIVQLLSPADSTAYSSTATDENGSFSLKAIKAKYIGKISFLGYSPVFQNLDLTSDLTMNLGAVKLSENDILLGDAEIVALVPPVVVKGDTIEYNAESYKSQSSDLLNDLIKKIPGMEVDADGNITANGKPVTKILVDGKEFFGNDISIALKNLPANMINKLQLFKEESETAKVTGFKDKDPQQVLNLKVKDELKQSLFGNLRAGYGSDNKYSHSGIANYMKNDNQLSVIGDFNNVDIDNDYMPSGIEKNKNIGVNFYRENKDKLRLGGNVRYMKNDNNVETQDNSYNFETQRYDKQLSVNQNIRDNFNTGINLSWTPDTLTTLYVRSYINFNTAKQIDRSSSISYTQKADTTSSSSDRYSTGDGYSISNSIVFGRKLSSKGRGIAININNTLRKDDSDGTNYSETIYQGGLPPKIIDQRLNTNNKTNSYAGSLTYIEPLGKDGRIAISYEINNSNTNRVREAWRKDVDGNYSIIDTAYTRNTENDYVNQIVGVKYQMSKEKFSYMIGFDVSPTYSKSKALIGDSVIENLKQHVVNYSPSIYLTYNPNQSTSLNFNYSGTTSQPGISQLSADTTIVSALMKYYGNPDLKPSFDNNMSIYYQKSDYETGKFMTISGGFNYTFNSIADYTSVDNHGNTSRTYRNVDGNMNANLGFMYNTPFRNRKFTFDTGTYVNYYRSIGFTNNSKSISDNIVLSQSLGLQFKTDKFDFGINSNVSHSIIKNNLASMEDRETTNYSVKGNFNLKLPFDFSIQSSAQYTYNNGYADDFKKSELLWNASVAKEFLRDKKGTFRLQFFDILNDRNSVTRVVKGNDYSDIRTNTVNRYFMLTVAYRFSIFRGTGVDSTEEIL